MIKVKIEYDHAIAGMSLWIYDEDADGRITIVEPINLTLRKEYEPGVIAPEPTIRFGRSDGNDFLNGLCNALVEAGFKPDEIKSHNKETEAIKYHLEDMRKLVFDK